MNDCQICLVAYFVCVFCEFVSFEDVAPSMTDLCVTQLFMSSAFHCHPGPQVAPHEDQTRALFIFIFLSFFGLFQCCILYSKNNAWNIVSAQ